MFGSVFGSFGGLGEAGWTDHKYVWVLLVAFIAVEFLVVCVLTAVIQSRNVDLANGSGFSTVMKVVGLQ